MKFQTVSALAIILVFAAVVGAQRGGGGGRGGPSGPPPNVSRPSPRPLPSTPVVPMTNPVAPMTNPVGPVVPYGGAGRGLGTAPPPPNRFGDMQIRDHRRRDVPVVVGTPYWSPYYGPYVWDYTYYDPYLRPPTIPGQLPGVYSPPPDQAFSAHVPLDSGPVPDTAPPEPVTVYYPEPNWIINLPEPAREPPPLGSSRADVLVRYGEPWGSFTVRGQETLSFRGGVNVVLEDGKVTRIR